MLTRIWPLWRGNAEPIEVEHEPDACAFCEAARRVRWSAPGEVIFLEDGARVHRLECVHPGSPLVVMCEPSTREAAETEARGIP